jgi:Methyltransferase domain
MTQELPQDKDGPSDDGTQRPLSWLSGGLGWRLRAMVQKARSAKVAIEFAVRNVTGLNETETKLIGDSQAYWNDQADSSLRQNSHWRGVGIFADDTRWLALGREHLKFYEEFARVVDLKYPLKRIVEWGCGGGMNAVHFGSLADEFCGVDISPSSLAECGKQMNTVGLHNFTPILVDAAAPESALSCLGGPCDVFISTYVFELLPTPGYGIRILRIANEMLAAGGIAMIQIKYSEGDATTRSRAWAYAKNLAWNATYRIEDFWQAAQQCGLTPRMVTLQPRQPLVNDRNYAYFLLQKPTR